MLIKILFGFLIFNKKIWLREERQLKKEQQREERQREEGDSPQQPPFRQLAERGLFFVQSECRESNSDHMHPMHAYCHYTTLRFIL